MVDRDLNGGAGAAFAVVANSAQAAGATSPHPIGGRLPVQFRGDTAFVQIAPLAPSDVLVLVNRP